MSSSASSSQVTGLTSTFTDSENAIYPQNTCNYQQWLNAYGRQSYEQFQQAPPVQNDPQFAFGQYMPAPIGNYAGTEDTFARPSASAASGSLYDMVLYFLAHQPQHNLYNTPVDVQSVPTCLQSQPRYFPGTPTRSPALPPDLSNADLQAPSYPMASINTSTSSSALNQSTATQQMIPITLPCHTPAISSSDQSAPKTQNRKRQRKAILQDSEHRHGLGSDDCDDDGFNSSAGMGIGGEIMVGMEPGVGSDSRSTAARFPIACTRCRKLKAKCEFPRDDNTCGRCKAGGHICVIVGRKPKSAPIQHEYLLAQIRQKDATIKSLLKQLHNPYVAIPLSIASYRMATSPSDQDDSNVLAWSDRPHTSGSKLGPRAFKLDVRSGGDNAGDEDNEDRDWSEQGSKRTVVQYGLTTDNTDDADGDTAVTVQSIEKPPLLPDEHVPLGLIANLSLNNRKARKNARGDPDGENDLDDDHVGLASEEYFLPGPMSDLDIRAMLIKKYGPPEIMVHGLAAQNDVDKLFDIFFQRVNPFVSLLDPVLHTPSSTFTRCPLLFTVICAISSRYYLDKSEMYPISIHFAKHAAANSLIDGWKSIELCQAYILMSIYAPPVRRWEEDRSWLYAGLAIRIAMDLNLYQVSTAKPQNERQEREILNRTRVWMACFNLDRSTAIQFGKPSTIKEDFIIRNLKDWYSWSKYNHPYDIHLCSRSAMLRIVGEFHDEIFSDPNVPSGFNTSVDIRSMTAIYDGHLLRYQDEWLERFAVDSDPNDCAAVFRCSLLPFLVGYSRLVMYSFGFQQACHCGIQPSDSLFFSKCLDVAKSVLENMIENLAPSGYVRYAPDSYFIFASFASAFLLKLLRPESSKPLANLNEQENEIFNLIDRLIQTLSSPDIAIDNRHTPKLYARFLAGLLSKYRRDGATAGWLHIEPSLHNELTLSGEHPSLATPSVPQPGAFSISPSYGEGILQNGLAPAPELLDSYQSMFNPSSNVEPNTPVHSSGATHISGAGPISFSGDFDILSSGVGHGMSEEDIQAMIQALRGRVWWQNVMMSG